jgi:hypothetical protein
MVTIGWPPTIAGRPGRFNGDVHAGADVLLC